MFCSLKGLRSRVEVDRCFCGLLSVYFRSCLLLFTSQMSNGKENEDRIAFLKEQLASQKRINSQIEEINYWKDRLDQQTEISSKLSHQLDILQKENYNLKRELLYYKNSGKDVGPPPSTPALHPNLKRKNSIPYYDNRMMDRVPPYKEKVANQENGNSC